MCAIVRTERAHDMAMGAGGARRDMSGARKMAAKGEDAATRKVMTARGRREERRSGH